MHKNKVKKTTNTSLKVAANMITLTVQINEEAHQLITEYSDKGH